MSILSLFFRKFWEKLKENMFLELGSILLATVIIELCRHFHWLSFWVGVILTFIIIFLHYFALRFFIIWRSSKIDLTVASFEDDVRRSNKIFLTSIIPNVVPSFERRFYPDLIYQLSILAGIYTKNNTPISNDIIYVLIFSNKKIVEEIKLPIFDGRYANHYSKIFKELGFKLAYLLEEDFIRICSINTNDFDIVKYDFALLEANTGSNMVYIPKNDIKSTKMEYYKLEDLQIVNNLKDISDKLKAEIFEGTELKGKYDFIKYTCVY